MSIHVLKMPVRNLSIVEEELLSEKRVESPVRLSLLENISDPISSFSCFSSILSFS